MVALVVLVTAAVFEPLPSATESAMSAVANAPIAIPLFADEFELEPIAID